MNKTKCSHLLKLFALSGLLILVTSSARAWRFSLPASSRAETVVVDAAGDIIAAGRAYYGGEVVKISGTTGELLWQFNASHNQTEQGVGSIALDSHGDVFVLIGTYRGVTKISGVTGKMIWQANIGGSTAGCQSRFNAIVVDREDNVVAAGTAGCLFNVAKLDGATGVERWHYEREGYGKAVAVDPFGNVAAAGIMNRNFGTVKLRGDNGQELWQKELNGVGNFTDVFEEANAVAMDQDGSVVVAGVTSNAIANFRDFTVARYLPDGTNQWTQIIDGQFKLLTGLGTLINQSNDIAYAVAIDGEGSAIAAGSIQSDDDIPASNPQAPEHCHVVKITRGGSIVWSRAAEDPAFEQEYLRGHAFALSVNAFGNVVVAGEHDGRFTLVKFWGRTGGRAWRRQLTSGTAGNGNLATAVVMDAASDVVAAGETTEASGFSQFTVVKLRRIDGLDYSADPTPPTAPETVVKYAPVVYLHSEDDYRPGNPMNFIRGSELKWSHQAQNLIVHCGDHTDVERGAIDAGRLGTLALLPYPHMPKVHSESSCSHRTDIAELKAYEHTRPFDGSARMNVLGQEQDYMKEGFYLDLDDEDELRSGIQSGPSVFPGATVFYEYVPRQYVAYWFFYPYNKFEVTLPYPPIIPDQEHEGDWERISIQLDQNDELVQVFYYHHEDGMLRSPGSIEFEGTHPVVYSARGSHGSYPDARDDYPTFFPLLHDHTDRGPKWSTWNNLLKVESQPWYGFGGAWGEVGELPPFPLDERLSGSHWTGPLGPSPYKRSFDKLLDTIPPQLNLPGNISVNADVPQGARVYFTVTATDNVTQNPRIACTSTSGSLFPVGNTTVACTATDDVGNSANGVFNIIVKGAGEQLIDLTILVKHFNFPKGTENSLLAKLQNAFTKLTRGDNAGACNQLRAFINEVQAQSGKKISVAEATQMLDATNRTRAVLGCQ